MIDLSIIIPNHNGAKYLAETLTSCLGINLEYEIIFIDDQSTDNSIDIVNNWIGEKNFPVEIFHVTSKKTPSNARNLGLFKARGKFLIFLDSDDVLNVFSVNNFLSNNFDFDLAISSYQCFDQNGNYFHGVDQQYFLKLAKYCSALSRPVELESFSEEIKQDLFRIWGLSGSKIFRRDFLIDSTITWDEHLGFAEDLKFFYDAILGKAKILINTKPQYGYRIGDPSQATHPKNPERLHKSSQAMLALIHNYQENHNRKLIFANLFDIWLFTGLSFLSNKERKDYFKKTKEFLGVLISHNDTFIHFGLHFGVKMFLRFLFFREPWIGFNILVLSSRNSRIKLVTRQKS